MSQLDLIREDVKKLYKTNPHIHMDVSITSPKISLKNAEATITRVFPHIFQISEESNGYVRKHTIQYADILINHIKILEM